MADAKPIRTCPKCGRRVTAVKAKTVHCSRKCGGGRPRKDPKKIFWSLVKKGAPNECWLWLGSRDLGGYGRYGADEVKAHRLSLEIATGKPLPDGVLACHRCDNPPCVNPAHLFAGTHLDNHRDRAAKGRGRDQRGEKHNMAKLTERDVLAIRAIKGVSHTEIGRRFGVSQTTVSDIIRRDIWSHVPEARA